MTDTSAHIEKRTEVREAEVVKPHKKKKLKLRASALQHWYTHVFIVPLAAPIILSFLPGTQGLAARGFETLKQAPQWYVIVLGTCMAWSFGYSAFRGWKSFLPK